MAKMYPVQIKGQPHGFILVEAGATAGGGGDLSSLNDVDITGLADGFILKWDAGTSTWIVAAESGGGPTTVPGQMITASQALSAGDIVSVWNDSGIPKVRKANATVIGFEAHGFVKAAVSSGATAEVFFSGIITGLSGMTPGARQYLSTTAGGRTQMVPSSTGNIVQFLGVAVSATEMNFEPQDPIELV